jgi:hypothetical protein
VVLPELKGPVTTILKLLNITLLLEE